MSEAEMAKQLDVSRQVVRDAFFRLSRLGFLTIRPQKATVVSRISIKDVLEARYIRMALEMENIRQACVNFSPSSIAKLEDILARQKTSIDNGEHEVFYNLDNAFHKEICAGADLEFTWSTIQEKKAHTDRVRFLSLAFSSQDALKGHIEIFAALRTKNADRAVEAVRQHLSQIEGAIDHLRFQNHEWFEDL